MTRLVALCALLALAACKKEPEARPAPGPSQPEGLRTRLEAPPPPPSLPATPPPHGADATAKPHPGPTRGADSAAALGQALVEAARKRDLNAFLQLTVSGRDIGLSFHPGVQEAMRRQVGLLPKKFLAYAQQIGPDMSFSGFRRGLSVDFQCGQGAKEPMPGFIDSEVAVKAGPVEKRFPVSRIVRIGGRWKLLDL